MNGFIHFDETARQTERAIFRVGLALGIDWDDGAAVQAVAAETIDRRAGLRRAARDDGEARRRMELCALVVLMRRIEVDFDPGDEYEPGPTWRALSVALDRELDRRLPA